MKNLCLEKYGVSELKNEEMILIDAGNKWRGLKRVLQYAWEALGVADAVDEFVEGWNSYECGN